MTYTTYEHNLMTDKAVFSQSIVDDFVVPVCHDFVEILYQDAEILLINKPSGLLSLSGKNPANWDSVHYRLVNGQEGVTAAFSDAKLIHRLDLGTSGVMVVGLNPCAVKNLNQQFQARTIKKQYIAMLEGHVTLDQGQIVAPIAKDKVLFPRVKICNSSGKNAQTTYNVLKRLENPARTLVQYTPITGRTHQLRIHSQIFGHPIIGCDLYQSETSQQKGSRLLLHASDIVFSHPVSAQQIHGHSDCPF